MWLKKETNPYLGAYPSFPFQLLKSLANPLIYSGSEKSSQVTLNVNVDAVKQEEEKKKLKPVCIIGLVIMLILLAGYCPYLRHLFGFQ